MDDKYIYLIETRHSYWCIRYCMWLSVRIVCSENVQIAFEWQQKSKRSKSGAVQDHHPLPFPCQLNKQSKTFLLFYSFVPVLLMWKRCKLKIAFRKNWKSNSIQRRYFLEVANGFVIQCMHIYILWYENLICTYTICIYFPICVTCKHKSRRDHHIQCQWNIERKKYNNEPNRVCRGNNSGYNTIIWEIPDVRFIHRQWHSRVYALL